MIFTALTYALLFNTAGCRDSGKKASASTEEKTSENIDNTEKTASPVQSGQERIGLEPAAGSSSSETVKLKASQESVKNIFNLVPEIGSDFITPDDFEIGPLLFHNGEDSYARFINNFFEELEKGKIARDMIDPGNIQFLTQVFESSIRSGLIPDNIRIGEAVIISGGSSGSENIRLNLRLFKGNNRTEGEIFLIDRGGSFKITNFNGDLLKLDIEYADNEGKFEPEIYRF